MLPNAYRRIRTNAPTTNAVEVSRLTSMNKDTLRPLEHIGFVRAPRGDSWVRTSEAFTILTANCVHEAFGPSL